MNGRSDFWDFRVYYDAANELLLGQTPYGKSFGVSSGFYKYSPVTLLFFTPFAILPYTTASILFYILIVFVFIKMLLSVHQFLSSHILSKSKKEYLPFLITSIIVSAHIIRELHLGNINLMLLLLFFVAFINIEKKRDFLAGVLIAIGLFFKPHFIVLLPLLVLKAHWKSLIGVIIISGVLVLLPAVFYGFEWNNVLINDWFNTMTSHNNQLMTSPNTVYGLVNNHILDLFGLPPNKSIIVIVLSIVATGVFGMVMFHKYKIENINKSLANYLEYFVLIALIPNLTHTDTEHFLWSLPIIMLLVYLIISMKNIRKRIQFVVFLLVIAFPWYLNSPDLLPNNIIKSLNQGGFLGLSNLIIIGISLFLFYMQRKKLY